MNAFLLQSGNQPRRWDTCRVGNAPMGDAFAANEKAYGQAADKRKQIGKRRGLDDALEKRTLRPEVLARAYRGHENRRAQTGNPS